MSKKQSAVTMPKRAPGVHLRDGSNVWNFCLRVPKDLRHLYLSQWAERGPLGTTDLQEANERAVARKAEWLATFARQRAEMKGQQLHRVETITPDMASRLAALVKHDALADDERLRTDATAQGGMLRWMELSGLPVPDGPADRFGGLPDAMADKLAEIHAAHDDETGKALARGKQVRALPAIQRAGHALGWLFDEQTPGIEHALQAGLKALRQVSDAKVRRDRGVDVDTPPKPEHKEPEKVMRMRDVAEDWIKKHGKGMAPRSLKAKELALKLYEKHTSNPPVKELTAKHGSDFRGVLMANGEASGTNGQRLIHLNCFLNFACDELDLIPKNPWKAIKIKSETETERESWTTEEVRHFFSSPLFTDYALPEARHAGADAMYWVPLIGLFTGARSSEICQLHVDDIQVSDDGQAFFDINKNHPWKKLKNKGAKRKTPMHSMLVRLGLLEYADEVRKAGINEGKLWPVLKLYKDSPCHYFSAWFGNYRRSLPPT